MNGDESPLKDSLAVNRAQFYYTELLWTYLVNKWDTVSALSSGGFRRAPFPPSSSKKSEISFRKNRININFRKLFF